MPLKTKFMENLNSLGEDLINDYSVEKDVRKRLSYVSKDHKSMMEFVSVIYKNLGHADFHSNKAIATAHKLSPDSIKVQLGAAQLYNLLEIKHGIGYKITNLFKRIYMPINETEKRSAIIESLNSSETYKGLFKEYEFHILPPISGLKNHFIRNWHLKEDKAEKTAQIFIDNLREYNLLDSRNVLTSGMPPKPENETPPANNSNLDKEMEDEAKNSQNGDENKIIPPPKEVGLLDILIPLKSSKTKAHLYIPEDYTNEDLDRIAKFVEALK